MKKETRDLNSVVASEASHWCSLFWLRPLSFHHQAKGDMVRLSQGCRLAERMGYTFRDSLVFSNRPLKVREKIRLRVEKDMFMWHGALRVGFTNVPPTARSLPLPCVAMPILTDAPGHWAAPVPESYCQPGSQLEFWVSRGGTMYVTSKNCMQHKLLTGVDLRKPLWAMIDIYGQTCSIFLLGSERRIGIFTQRSRPAPEHLTTPDVDIHCGSISDVSSLNGNSDESISSLDTEGPADEDCVVCRGKKARITLPCGHQCLCKHCSPRVLQQFGFCPLCRYVIRAPSAEE
ncbi:E3 ubiquitin-protein ligase NEURL3 [Xiphias gladius]|uniref:E3 ubiquitin-protein ligase NEURL3 n=1 Tax=Xiphias gladius TaxID=8245 RepID=UPI001A998244|nr:E3 ubiquitin-protein ligase NEURL3 [Xiphias gladius]